MSDLRVPFEEKYELSFQLQKVSKLQVRFIGDSDDLVSKLFHFSSAQGDMVDTSKSIRYEVLKALVWFWLIDETLSANLVYQSDYEIGSTF